MHPGIKLVPKTNQPIQHCQLLLKAQYHVHFVSASSAPQPRGMDPYRLHKAIFGMPTRSREAGLITIPAGSIVQVFTPLPVGLIDVAWEGQSVWVFAMDLLECGDPSGAFDTLTLRH